jgi:hypothetical protein
MMVFTLRSIGKCNKFQLELFRCSYTIEFAGYFIVSSWMILIKNQIKFLKEVYQMILHLHYVYF